MPIAILRGLFGLLPTPYTEDLEIRTKSIFTSTAERGVTSHLDADDKREIATLLQAVSEQLAQYAFGEE